MNRVSFHPDTQMVEVLNIDDYTPCEIEAAWYSEAQMEKITKGCVKHIRKMDAGKCKKYCIRGLEGHSKLGSITKNRNRAAAWAAVLTEQAQQWDEERVDEQAIALAYQRTASSCQMWAQVMGRRDQQAAEIILFEERKEELESNDQTCSASGTLDVTAKTSTKHSLSSSASLVGRSPIPSQRQLKISQLSSREVTNFSIQSSTLLTKIAL